jgi:tetratricopeptide (TPR) repeat protein
MKTTTICLIVMILLAGGVLAQERSSEIQQLRMDLLGALTGDLERFERGMQTLESLLAKSPQDPVLKVLHGTGVFSRAGSAFEKGDMANAMKSFQSGLEEMAQAVDIAPENILVRARRGVILISASREMPPGMAKPLTELAVGDFEKVLQVREREQTFSQGSAHKRGELLTGLADGWNRLGNPEKARGYFERISRDLKGTVYEEKAAAWLEGKPEAKSAAFFACSGCHTN